MTIDILPFMTMQQTPLPAGRAASAPVPGTPATLPFSELLAQLSTSASCDPDKDSMRAPVAPQIGKPAVPFSARPVVQLASLTLPQEAAVADDSRPASIAETLADIARANGPVAALAAMSLDPATGSTAVPPVEAASLSAEAVPVAAASPNVRSAGTMRPAVLPLLSPWQAFDGIPHADGSVVGPAKGVAPSAGRTAPAATTPFHAALVALEDGMRVVVRLPGLEDDERAELSRRLAELFTDMGRAPPELVTLHPAHTGQEV